MNCGICLQPLFIFYYKGKCNCNVRYHYECILKWYKIKKRCIYCGKCDTNEIALIKYKYYKYVNIICIFFISLFFFIFFIIIKVLA